MNVATDGKTFDTATAHVCAVNVVGVREHHFLCYIPFGQQVDLDKLTSDALHSAGIPHEWKATIGYHVSSPGNALGPVAFYDTDCKLLGTTQVMAESFLAPETHLFTTELHESVAPTLNAAGTLIWFDRLDPTYVPNAERVEVAAEQLSSSI